MKGALLLRPLKARVRRSVLMVIAPTSPEIIVRARNTFNWRIMSPHRKRVALKSMTLHIQFSYGVVRYHIQLGAGPEIQFSII